MLNTKNPLLHQKLQEMRCYTFTLSLHPSSPAILLSAYLPAPFIFCTSSKYLFHVSLSSSTVFLQKCSEYTYILQTNGLQISTSFSITFTSFLCFLILLKIQHVMFSFVQTYPYHPFPHPHLCHDQTLLL